MKNIWVLGAGSSIGHSSGKYPSINEFFSKAVKLRITKSNNNRIKPKFSELKSFVNNVFGRDILDQNEAIDVERLLTYVEIEVEKYNSVKFVNLKEQILLLIRMVLDKLAKENEKFDKNSEYNLFRGEIKKEDTILTFNWDLLLDDILNREAFLEKRENYDDSQYANMLLHLSAYGEDSSLHSSISPPYTKFSKELGYYLKLHGSIDWLYCTNSSCRGFSKVFPTSNYKKTHYCAECHEKMNFLLVPPVLNKQYNAYPFIKRIWNTAAKEIQNADRIIIWGYSFPPTDFYSNWLLNQTGKNLKELIIINPACIEGKRDPRPRWNRVFIETLENLFKPKIREVSFKFYETFDDYYKNISTGRYDLKAPFSHLR